MASKKKPRDLGDELFKLVEAEQGYAFISDGIAGLPVERVLDIARGALKHTEIVARRLRKFLKEHEVKKS